MIQQKISELVKEHNELNKVRPKAGNHLSEIDQRIVSLRKEIFLSFLSRPRTIKQIEARVSEAGLITHPSRIRATLESLVDSGAIRREKSKRSRAMLYSK